MYDIIIIGGGPAGLTSAIYAKEANKSTLVLEKMGTGGQLNNIFTITNYPGFDGIEGFELATKMKNQALIKGAEFKNEQVIDVDFSSRIKKVFTSSGVYEAKNIIIATGAHARELGVEQEKEFYGKGISYCATCDGNFFKDKVVAVVGGGNSSIYDCLYLSNLVKKIYLIHRREEFKASAGGVSRVQTIEKSGKIELKLNAVVSKLMGDDKLKEIELTNTKTGKKERLQVDGVFVAVGRIPDTDVFEGKLNLTKDGFIQTKENMETSVSGVYAVGDVREKVLRQVITACADGAVAVSSIVNKDWLKVFCFKYYSLIFRKKNNGF